MNCLHTFVDQPDQGDMMYVDADIGQVAQDAVGAGHVVTIPLVTYRSLLPVFVLR